MKHVIEPHKMRLKEDMLLMLGKLELVNGIKERMSFYHIVIGIPQEFALNGNACRILFIEKNHQSVLEMLHLPEDIEHLKEIFEHFLQEFR